jgi:hypothetical protein
MASVIKRCVCPQPVWSSCPHSWVVRYRTDGGRGSGQRERSFGRNKRGAEDSR